MNIHRRISIRHPLCLHTSWSWTLGRSYSAMTERTEALSWSRSLYSSWFGSQNYISISSLRPPPIAGLQACYSQTGIRRTP